MANEMLEKLKPLVDKIAKHKKENFEQIGKEAHTRAEFVKPFFEALGYTKGISVLYPEYSAGFKGDESVDYALLECGKPLAMVEIKHHSINLDSQTAKCNPKGQLAGYFGSCVKNGCKFGILTNGLEYRFFADTQTTNTMDSEPFMVLNLESEISGEQLEILEYFKCGNLQSKIKIIHSKAKIMPDKAIIKTFLEKEIKNPSKEFVTFVNKQLKGIKIKESNITTAFKELIADKADEIIATKEAQNADSQDTSKELSDEENQAFYIVRGILLENSGANLNNIIIAPATNYVAILFGNSSRKWICRLYLKYTNKYIETPNAEKLPIKNLADIYKYKNELAESLKMRLK